MLVSDRLRRYIEAAFEQADAPLALRLLSDWTLPVEGAGERLHAAALIRADGDVDALAEALDLGKVDYRDLLMYTGLEHEDWPKRLDELAGEK